MIRSIRLNYFKSGLRTYVVTTSISEFCPDCRRDLCLSAATRSFFLCRDSPLAFTDQGTSVTTLSRTVATGSLSRPLTIRYPPDLCLSRPNDIVPSDARSFAWAHACPHHYQTSVFEPRGIRVIYRRRMILPQVIGETAITCPDCDPRNEGKELASTMVWKGPKCGAVLRT